MMYQASRRRRQRRRGKSNKQLRRLRMFEALEDRRLLATVPLTFVVDRFIAIDNPDGGFDDGDFYAVVKMGSLPPQDTKNNVITGRDIRPNWRFTQQVDLADSPIVVQVQIWDEDGGLRFGDDIMDIAPPAERNTLEIIVDLYTGLYTGDVGSPHDMVQGGGHNNVDRGRLFFHFESPFADVDTDGDGLLDRWERFGLDIDLDGNIDLNLPAMGADPNRKDLFVEVDAMQDRAPSPLPPITGASNATPILITSTGHGLTTGTRITIQGVTGNTAANGTWTITRVNNDQFTLDGERSVGNGFYNTGGTWSLADLAGTGLATGTSLDLVIDAFLKAPVPNPNGTNGIRLHVMLDELNLPLANWDTDRNDNGQSPYGEDLNANGVLDCGADGDCGTGDAGDEDLDNNDKLRDGDPADQGGYAFFRALKQMQFGTAAERNSPDAVKVLESKRLAFRYAVFANYRVDSRGEGNGVRLNSGGRAHNQSDFHVSLGRWTTVGGRPDEQAGLFMHELGHTLGLAHGGKDDINYKPNYHSVMNYSWNTPSTVNPESWTLTFSTGTFPMLDEADLDESVGIQGHAGHRVFIGPFVPSSTTPRLGNETGPVNWNNSGSATETKVKADINRVLPSLPASPDQKLVDHNDWAALQYKVWPKGLRDPQSGVGHDEEYHEDLRIELNEVKLAGNPQTGSRAVAADGTLTLFMGPHAHRRGLFNQDVHEAFLVEHVAGAPGDPQGETVQVSAFGFHQQFSGVRRIYAEAGDGDDVITISKLLRSPVEMHGQDGNDRLQSGGGRATIFGGVGNDVIIAAGAVGNRLFGGDGDDFIVGSDEGADTDPDFNDTTLFGDVIDGGAGNDTIYGLGGADLMNGGAGDDWLDGGIGSDLILGGSGNDVLYAGAGFGDSLHGEDGDDEIYGSHEGNDTITGGAGNDRLYGQGGNDSIRGDDGDDVVDGGPGTDILLGNNGDDHLLGGGGNGDRLEGGDGDDRLEGSDDGADVILGGAGRDYILGHGGNDAISGGDDDDLIDGGAGDDIINGDAGSDVLIGGGGHDVLHGHHATPADDDQRVDYVYGDFGTGRNEPGSGRDQLFGGGGNDLLFGEGDDDAIHPGSGNSDLVDFGSGEGPNPQDFVPPTPTPPPALQPAAGLSRAHASLPTGLAARGRWSELAGSATGGGLSNSPAIGIEPAMAADAAGNIYAAWADARNGNFEIYVAHYSDAGGWRALAGSASQGGVSRSPGSSRNPSLVIGSDGQPLVAWTEVNNNGGSDIRAARFDPAAAGGQGDWIAIGNSPGSSGISGTGTADDAHLLMTNSGPAVIWLDRASGVTNVFARRFDGNSWAALGGASSASGRGISNLAAAVQSVRDLHAATDGNKIAVAWSRGDSREIYVHEFSGGAWSELAGAAPGIVVTTAPGQRSAPTVAYHQGRLFAAWQNTFARPQDLTSAEFSEIYAAVFDGQAWQPTGPSAASDEGVSRSHGRASRPRLAAGGNQLHLAWSGDWRVTLPGHADRPSSNIVVLRWNGIGFDVATGDTAGQMIKTQQPPLSLAMTVDGSGKPIVSWTAPHADSLTDRGPARPQIYLRANLFEAARTFTAHANQTVQQILDQNQLGPGDVVFVYGSVPGFTISASDAGVTIAGLPDSLNAHGNVVSSVIQGGVHITAAANVIMEDLSVTGLVDVESSSQFTLRRSQLTAGMAIRGSSDAHVAENVIGGPGLEINGGSARANIEHNRLGGTSVALRLGTGGSVDALIRGNRIAGGIGIDVSAASSGRITANAIQSATTGLSLRALFTGVIDDNDVQADSIAVFYGAPAALSANRIHGSPVGVESSITNTTDAFGFVGSTQPNHIFGNALGVRLNGQMRGQHVQNNATGVQGIGVLGGADFSHANVIVGNQIGVDINGTVQFNRIGENEVGIVAHDKQLITHNVMYRNTRAAVRAIGRTDVRIVHNTMYAAAGDAIRLQGNSSNVEIRNNILWADSGYAIYVANDSQRGFFSDYNTLYASGDGKLVHWSNTDFNDILDWQADVPQFDLHSRGRTRVDVHGSEPRFIHRGSDDYRVIPPLGGWRHTSPTVDAGDPLTDLGRWPAAHTNLLNNAGFESGLDFWNFTPGATTQSGTPPAFAGQSYFTAATSPAGFAQQTVDLTAAGFSAADLDSGRLVVNFGGRVRAAAEVVPDAGRLTLTYLDAGGASLGESSAHALNVSDRWELIGQRARLPLGTRRLVFRFDAVRNSGTTNDSYLDHAFVLVLPETVWPDQGAYGNTPLDPPLTGSGIDPATALPARLSLAFPDMYVDWERDRGRLIRWHSHHNIDRLPVRIDLYQDSLDGPQWLRNISPGTADDGEYEWTPADSNVDYGTHGLRIQISLVGLEEVLTRSSESFSVPENTATFYVNDGSTANDQYTSKTGDNRHTGKLPAAPKPLPNNILRSYKLQPGHTLHVDNGNYALLQPLLISNALGLGDDEGFQFTGPTSPGKSALLRHANPDFTAAPVVELNDAAFLNLQHLHLDGGVHGLLIHQGSSSFHVSRVNVTRAQQHGIVVVSALPGSALEHVTVTSSGASGLRVTGPLDRVVNSEFAFNLDAGMHLQDSVNVRLEGNRVHDNRGHGIQVRQFAASGGLQVVVGHADLSAARGNIVWANGGSGIDSSGGDVLIVGNVVHGHKNAGTAGIRMIGGEVRQNVVHSNYDGISGNAVITGNRTYGHTQAGIVVWVNGSAFENVSYSNDVGLVAWSAAPIGNNLVYANSNQGIRVFATHAQLINNTIYQPIGDGVHILPQTHGVQLRNNIVWAGAGAGIFVPASSQLGFQSDFNLLLAGAGGNVGHWQGGSRKTLADWQNASFADGNSVSQDPLFVNPLGADGVLGFISAAQDGRDDDFHLQSKFGSFHEAAIAPIIGQVSGLPQWPSATVVVDAAQSPGIDRGFAGDAFHRETAPNGGFVNLGAYGNTPQASRSPSTYVLVSRPDGNEVWPAGQQFAIRWRSHDAAGNVRIDLLDEAGVNVVQPITDATANSGQFDWLLPSGLPAGRYRVRVTRLDGAASDISDAPFTIPPPSSVFYVNDAVVAAGDWTTAPGDDANDGLSPDRPKASIRGVLQAYDLGAGDVIRVDAGHYALSANILIEPQDSGVTVQGYHDAAFPDRKAVLNRGNTAIGSFVIQLVGADDVTIDGLWMTGGDFAVAALSGADSDRVTISRSHLHGNARGGIYWDLGNDAPRFSENRVYQNAGVGIQVFSANAAVVAGNVVYEMTFGTGIEVRSGIGGTNLVEQNEVYGNTYGIVANGATGSGVTVSRNRVYDQRFRGITAHGNVLVQDNEVFRNSSSSISDAGILADGGATVIGNTLHDNFYGINALGATTTVRGNRIFRSDGAGIREFNAVIQGNTLFANPVGISSASGKISGNLIYDSALHGIWIDGGGTGARVHNNTIYQPLSGNAVTVGGAFATSHVDIRGNIFSVGAGYAISVAANSEVGLTSDYNTLHTTGSGILGRFGGRNYTQITDWFYELGLDRNSLTSDPQFADPDGPDGHLGFSQAELGSPQLLDDVSATLTGTWTTNATGFGGNHQQSAAAGSTATYRFNGLKPGRYYQMAASWPAHPTADATLFTLIDGTQRRQSVRIDQRVAPSDFHADSASWKRLMTVLISSDSAAIEISAASSSQIVADAIRLVEVVGDGSADDDFRVLTSSATIDSGDPLSAFSSETAPHGGRVNQGHTGNTLLATSSASQLVQLLSPIGLEKFEHGQSVNIQWRSAGVDPAATIDIDLLAANNNMIELPIARNVANSGVFSWIVPAALAEADYRIRVTAAHGVRPSSTSAKPFVIANSGFRYYVNDNATTGDVYTTVAGNNAFSGKRPDQPMASVAALLAAYDLDASDVIHIDTGVYQLARNIVVAPQDSGVRIEGPAAVQPAAVAELNRGNTAAGSYGFEFSGADDVVISHLTITGGEVGIFAGAGRDSDRLQVLHSHIHGNSRVGLYLGTSNDDATIANNRIRKNAQGGVLAEHVTGARIRDNQLQDNVGSVGGTGIVLSSSVPGADNDIRGNDVSGHGVGMQISSDRRTQVENNRVHHNTSGISASGNVIVTSNEVFAHDSNHWSTGYGISVSSGAAARNNVLYANDRGVDSFSGIVEGNRIFNNRDMGIQAALLINVAGNTVYSNPLGIVLYSVNGGQIQNNLVYDSASDGIYVASGATLRIENNTVYQPTSGDAVQLGGPTPGFVFSNFPVSNIELRNNLLSVAQSYVIRVAADSVLDIRSDYNLFHTTGSGRIGRWEDRDFSDRLDWHFQLGLDQHSLHADPQFVDVDGPDNILGYQAGSGIDGGLDDNFGVASSSLTIDAGHPASSFAAEPQPNGARRNLGHTGDTRLAAKSAPQTVQVLSPNGYEKLIAGRPSDIRWRTHGLTATTPIAWIDAGGLGVENWSANNYQQAGQVLNVIGNVDLSQVTQPAPAAVYQTLAYGGFGAANRLAYRLPVDDGNYSVRLHFVEPVMIAAGQRKFDIGLQGSVVETGFDIFVAAGGRLKAITRTYSAAALGGQGIQLELRNATGAEGAVLAAIEVTSAVPNGDSQVTADIEISTDQGTNWTVVELGVPLDHMGRGKFVWTAGPETNGNTALLRITARSGGQPVDQSDAPFLITNGGRDYYVNDATFTKDVFTTAAGNNLASGKRPDQPMASLQALLAAYDLELGDVVHVDAGDYRLYQSISLTADDSGVRIEGPSAVPAGKANQARAVLNRGNTLTGVYTVDVHGAKDVTLEHLSLTGSTIGVLLRDRSGSDRVTVSNNDIFGQTGQQPYGVYVAGGNNDVRIIGNRIHNNQNAPFAGVGVFVGAPRAQVSGNEVFGNVVGIETDAFITLPTADQMQIFENTVHANTSSGIRALQSAMVSGNLVFGHNAFGGVGILVRSATASQNVVFQNDVGIFASQDASRVTGNRVYANRIGIRGQSASRIDANHVYSNSSGIAADVAGFHGQIENNLVYGNTNLGIHVGLSFFAGTRITNNTVLQNVGDAIRIENASAGTAVRNNVLWVDSGFVLHVAANSQTGFVSDYNLLFTGTTGAGKVAFWGNAARDTLADWTAASQQDTHSLTANPAFVDMDGSDDVLGYHAASGQDGGHDDNFHLRAGSLAIDRGDAAAAPATDRQGFGRVDDPATANQGSPGTAFVDLGAHEFQGSSADNTPPQVVSSDFVVTGPPGNRQSRLLVTFSEPIDTIDAVARANYDLREAGANGVFGDQDDNVIAFTAAYFPALRTVSLNLQLATGVLAAGRYQLTVRGTTSIHDLAGVKLDGDKDGAAGGDSVSSNRPPQLTQQSDRNVKEGELLQVSVTGTDPDAGQTVEYRLAHSPAGMTIDAATGAISWTPGEEHGGNAYVVSVAAVDSGSPRLATVMDFLVTVEEVNQGPTIAAISPKNVVEEELLLFTIVAFDADLPLQTLSYSLVAAPAGAAIHPVTGAFRWAPSESQGPGDHQVTVRVTDNGVPALHTDATFTISVQEHNLPPTLTSPGNQQVVAGQILTINMQASDPDLPANGLIFELTNNSPASATINAATGKLQWTPSFADAGQTFTMTVKVTDNGTPALSATVSFDVSVTAPLLSWQNPQNRFDVLPNGIVTPHDAAVIISRIIVGGSGALPTPTSTFKPPPFYDVSGDNIISPLDAAQVISRIAKSGSGEGERGPVRSSGASAERNTIQLPAVAPAASSRNVHPPETQVTASLAPRNLLERAGHHRARVFAQLGSSLRMSTTSGRHESRELDALIDELAADVAENWWST